MLRRRCGDKCEQDQPCQRASRSDVAYHRDMRRRCATRDGRGTALMRSQDLPGSVPKIMIIKILKSAQAMGAEVSGLIPRWDDDSQRQMPAGGEGAGSGLISMPSLSFDGAGVRRSECCYCQSARPGGVHGTHDIRSRAWRTMPPSPYSTDDLMHTARSRRRMS